MKHIHLIAPFFLVLLWVGVEVFRSEQTIEALGLIGVLLLTLGLSLLFAVAIRFVRPSAPAHAWVIGTWLALGFKEMWNFVERASTFWGPVTYGLNIMTFGVALLLAQRAAVAATREGRSQLAPRLLSIAVVIVAGAMLMHLAPSWTVWAQRIAFCVCLLEFAAWLAAPTRPLMMCWALALASISLLEQLDPIYRELSVWLAGMYILCATIRLRVDSPWTGRPGTRTVGLTLFLAVVAFGAANLLIERDGSALSLLEERGVAQVAINIALSISDFDGDGHGVLFGQADCAPFDARRGPGHHERRDTAHDDNCQRPRRAPNFSTRLRVNKAPRPVTGDVVLIVIDSLRYDTSLSAQLKSLRTLENRAVRYERAYSTSTYTVQSIFGVLTGALPPQTAYHWRTRHLSKPSRVPQTLFERATVRGFDTGAAGIVQEVLDDFSRGARVVQKTGLHALPEVTEEQAIQVWNALDTEKRRFLYVHYIHLHNHLRPGRPLNVEELQKNYLEYASEVDASLGRLLAQLPADAAIIVTSDHGESFGTHGRVGHSIELTEELLHVPLYVAVPGVAARREQRVTSLLSLSPTIEALSVETAPTARGFYFCIDQEPCSDLQAPAALERRSVHRHSLLVGNQRTTHDVRTDRWTSFDLRIDPGATHPTDATSQNKAELIEWEEFGMDPSAPPVAFSFAHESR